MEEIHNPTTGDIEHELIKHYDHVVDYLRRMTGRPCLAEDLAQETYVRAISFVRNRGPPTYPRRWLRRIAHNVTVDYVGRRPEMQGIAEALVQNGSSVREADVDVLEEVVRREDTRRMQSQLKGLRPQDAALLRGFYYEGLCCDELAKQHNLLRDNVKIRLYRARQRLAKRMKQGGGADR